MQLLKEKHPDAKVLVHPESPAAVIELANVVGSTTALIKAAKNLAARKLIVATDNGIFYKTRQAAPGKIFMKAPPPAPPVPRAKAAPIARGWR